MKEKKKLLKCALLFAFILLFQIPNTGRTDAHADDSLQTDEEKMQLVISDANAYILKNYGIADYYPAYITVAGERHYPSAAVFDSCEMIAYWNGEPLESINPSSADKVRARGGDELNRPGEIIYRYLCYDKWGKRLPNPNFPADALDRDPKGVQITRWEDMSNPVWEYISTAESMTEIKNLIMSNFRKSLFSYLKHEVELYFLYRNPYAGSKEEYYKNWNNYYVKQFEGDLSQKINVSMLPTKNTSGLALFKKSNGYYTVIPLGYQENTDAVLRILHVAVDGEDPDYIVSSDFHPINGSGGIRKLKNGEKIQVKALESEAYDVVGHAFFENKDGEFKVPSKGSKVGSIFKAAEFNMVYNYDFRNDTPYLVFYYKKNIVPVSSVRTGRIVVSSGTYDVSRAIPTDENVRIDSYVDDADLCDVRWGLSSGTIEIPIIISGISNSGTYSFSKSIEYYKLHHAEIFKLDRVKVYNDKLQFNYPIIQTALRTPPAEVRRYSQNVLGLNIAAGSISLGGHRFNISSGWASDEELGIAGEYGGGSGGGGSHSPVVYLSLADTGGDGRDIYISESALSGLESRISAGTSVSVRNDYLSIAGTVISDGSAHINRAPKPREIPKRPVVITKPEHHIKNTARNGDALTRGEMVYLREAASDPALPEKDFEISGNNVFIHTPAVNDTVIEDKRKFDQRSDAERERNLHEYGAGELAIVPLDHVIKLDIISRGKHIDEKGYGTREYREHLKAKLVKIPFDAYVSKNKADLLSHRVSNSLFHAAGSLLSFSPATDTIYFKAAPWVVEKPYRIMTYSVAENALDTIGPSHYANLDFNYDAASQETDVLVVGRLFGLTLERLYDPAFYSRKPAEFWSVGKLTKDGLNMTRFAGLDDNVIEKWCLPLTSYKSPYKITVGTDVKLGYPIVFSVKTMGTFFTEDDVLIARPDFYHIDEAGNIDENIHVYCEKEGELINLYSNEAELKAYVNFKDFSGINGQINLIKTASIINQRRSKSFSEILDGREFKAMPDLSRYNSAIARPMLAGTQAYALASYPFRIFIGDILSLPDGVEIYRAGMAVQKWTGIYTVPESTVIFRDDGSGVPDFGSRVDKGRLGLIFKIGVSRNNNADEPELEYLTETYDGYTIEAYTGQPEYPKGTVVIYSVEKTIDDDKLLN